MVKTDDGWEFGKFCECGCRVPEKSVKCESELDIPRMQYDLNGIGLSDGSCFSAMYHGKFLPGGG
jgi:hypothetical protein